MLFKFPNTDSIAYNKTVRLDELQTRRKVSMEDSDTDLEMSEKSYPPLFTAAEFLESLINLNFNLTWIFITIVANMILYFFLTYEMVFELGQFHHFEIGLIQSISLIVIAFDAVALFMFCCRKEMHIRRAYRRIHVVPIYIYSASLVSVFLQIVRSFHSNFYINIFNLFCIGLRFWKICLYIALMNNLPGQITLRNLYKKYFIIWAIIVHSMSCIWILIGCNEGHEICDKKFKGNLTYWNSVIYYEGREKYLSGRDKFSHIELYGISVNYVLGGLTSLGYQGASKHNSLEEFVCICIMFLHLWLVYCLLNADFIMCIIHTKSFDGQVVNRLQAMEQDLIQQQRVSYVMKRRVIGYYKEFFLRDKAVKYATLMKVVPDPFVNETKTEIFWNAMEKCKIFSRTSDAFKRAVMRNMESEAFSRGDILFDLGKLADEMCFVARGNLYILSGEDFDSPIVTLGQGSLIGQINLIYSKTTKFKVVVATYSVIYTLRKRDFWTTVFRYRKLEEGFKLHKSFRKHIKSVKQLQQVGDLKSSMTIGRKWKCLESKKILSEFKEKIKNEAKLASSVEASKGVSRNLYAYSEIHNQKSYDDIFLITSWPWILRPNSQLMRVWNRCVLAVVFYVAISFPYLAAYTHIDILNTAVSTQAVFLVYIVDILIQIFTAIESKTETIWHVSDILSTRMEKVTFVMDIIASIPFHTYSFFIATSGRLERIFTFICLNRLLKIYKVDVIIREFEKTTKIHIGIVKAVKCALYVSYLGYIGGALYYTVSCFDTAQCYENSWVNALRQMFEKYPEYDQQIHDPMKFMPTISFQDILGVVTNTCQCLTPTLVESILQSVLSVLGILVTNFLFAEYAAGLTLKDNSAIEYLEFFEATKRFMVCIDMPKYLQTRVFNQLKTSWRFNEGVARKQLYIDCPERLYNTLQIAINTESLASLPLFQGLEEDILNLVTTKCTELNLPPREYVVYSGEQARTMYIILKGFCSVMEGTVGKRILGPGSFINGMEACLGLPSITTICSNTYVNILKLDSIDIKYVCAKFPQFHQVIMNSVDEEAISRVFYRVSDYSDFYKHQAIDEVEQSFFIFPTYRRHPLNIDYKSVYDQSSWKIVRYVLMRRTILPYGKFLRNWEIFKAISAFLLAVMTPTGWVLLYYVPDMSYLYYVLHAIGTIDMYIRLHVCYYNEKGILVTHPKYTAKYYLTHAFLVDFMGTFPIALVLTKLGSIESTKTVILLNCNVLLQMYRFPEAFSYTYQSIYKTNNVVYQAAKCIPFMLVLLNTLACVIMYVSSFTTVVSDRIIMTPNKFSWIYLSKSIEHLNTTEPYVFLLTSLYFTTGTFLGINFNQFSTHTKPESIFVICCIVMGYVFKMYIMVGIVHSRYVGNQKLTAHRNNMVQLIDYLEEEKLPKKLQVKVIEHFIQTWKITDGFHTKAILSVFHLPLMTDFCLHTYLETLQKVAVFEEASTNFFRHIGRHLNEIYLKKDQDVIKVNDVVKVIYVVHQGEVVIHGPTGEAFATLKRGSMFGNIDEVECTRSMVRARTSTATDLFVMRTTEYYSLLQNGYIFIYRKMHHFLLLHNLSYIKSSDDNTEADMYFAATVTISNINKLISSKYYCIFMVMVDVSACILSSYQVAFQAYELIFYILYLLDAFHIGEVIINFYVPYEDNRGDLVTDLKKIRKRYMTPMKFYFDALTVFPYEIFCLLFQGEQRSNYRVYLAGYRILRAANVYHYFSGYKFLSNTVIWVRLALNLTYMIILVHLGACVFYIIACPGRNCQSGYWVDYEDEHVCGQEYLCSIYMMMSIVSTAAYTERRLTRSLPGMGMFIVVAILSHFLLVQFLGDLTALIRNSVYNLTKYDFEVKEFLTHLSNSFVSMPFLEKMKKYCYKLWLVGKGRQIPTILLSSPNYLIEEIKMHAYGSHIFNNVVFENCHPDFLRTVIRKLKVQKFFVGDTICHQEDINNTMYFIHKGIVDVYSVTETEEVHVDTLQELDCFGMIQGLFTDTPHTHSFRATAPCTILFLTYDAWCVLLRFFPASKYEIYKNLEIIDTENN